MNRVSTSTMRLLAFIPLVGTLLLAAILAMAGLPIPAAATVAALGVGALTGFVERRLGQDIPALGMIFLGLGGLSGIVATVEALRPLNGFLVGTATLAVEIAITIGLVKAYRRLVGKAGAVARHRLASRRGWRYQEHATAPVAGPRTVLRLKSVPNGATKTDGDEVVSGTVNGLAVTVFDRARPRSRSNEPVQTVWVVHLPMRLPYLASSFARFLALEEQASKRPQGQTVPPADPMTALSDQPSDADINAVFDAFFGPAAGGRHAGPAEAHTDRPDFARTLMTPEVRAVAARPGFPAWWIEAGYLYSAHEGDTRRGAPPDLVEARVEQLIALAARFPWPALAPYAR